MPKVATIDCRRSGSPTIQDPVGHPLPLELFFFSVDEDRNVPEKYLIRRTAAKGEDPLLVVVRYLSPVVPLEQILTHQSPLIVSPSGFFVTESEPPSRPRFAYIAGSVVITSKSKTSFCLFGFGRRRGSLPHPIGFVSMCIPFLLLVWNVLHPKPNRTPFEGPLRFRYSL